MPSNKKSSSGDEEKSDVYLWPDPTDEELKEWIDQRQMRRIKVEHLEDYDDQN